MKQGKKLAEGAAAEVFAWGDDQIVKLFKPALDERSREHEIRMTRAVHAAGAPAPEVVEVVTINGRTGVVLPRYDGPTLVGEMLEGRIGPEEGGAMMAALHHGLHALGCRAEVPTFCQFVQFNADRLRRRGIDADIVDKALSVAMALPERGVLCHGDLHGLNVILTPKGPRIIDWMSAIDAPPLVDVARHHMTLTLCVPDGAQYDPVRASDAPFMAEYARLSGIGDLETAVVPYMVVMSAMRLADLGLVPSEEARLVAFVRDTRV